MVEKLSIPYVGKKPFRATEGAVAADLYADESAYILPGEEVKIPTDTKIAVPEGYAALLFLRSSLSKKTLMLTNSVGVIDVDYRGNLIFSIYNGNIKPFLMALAIGSISFEYDNEELYKPSVPGAYKVSKGDRIGQVMIVKLPDVEFTEVSELDKTERGEGGFGSTGA